jgi:hypothetical protein
MDELKTSEERNDSQKSGWPFSKNLTEAWEQLEERTLGNAQGCIFWWRSLPDISCSLFRLEAFSR